jgi:HEAT repeat protein
LEEFVITALDKNFMVNKDPWEFDIFQFYLAIAINKVGVEIFRESLMHLCNTQNWQTKFDAINMLLSIGDTSGVSVLEKALDNEDWMIRVHAAESLLAHGDNRAWDVLARALADDVFEDFWLKVGIVDILADSGDSRTFDLFREILNDVDTYAGYDEIIAKIITWMGNSGDQRAIEPIKKWQYKELVNCDADVVEKALRTLE